MADDSGYVILILAMNNEWFNIIIGEELVMVDGWLKMLGDGSYCLESFLDV